VSIHSAKIIEIYSHLQVFWENTLKCDEYHFGAVEKWLFWGLPLCRLVGSDKLQKCQKGLAQIIFLNVRGKIF
jgi:hypothetical protein